jgi:hypothetical protein
MTNTLIAPPTWLVEDDGRTTEEIIYSLLEQGMWINDIADEIVRRSQDSPTLKGTIYRFVGVKDIEFPNNVRLLTRFIFDWSAASPRNYQKPSIRAGLLLREKFLQSPPDYPKIVIMHKPVLTKTNSYRLMGFTQIDDNDWICGWSGRLARCWARQGDHLFVFLAA